MVSHAAAAPPNSPNNHRGVPPQQGPPSVKAARRGEHEARVVGNLRRLLAAANLENGQGLQQARRALNFE